MVEQGNRVNGNMVRTALTTLKSLLPQDILPTDMQIETLLPSLQKSIHQL
jgi:hypothetical protein